jgi:hypothetical protein
MLNYPSTGGLSTMRLPFLFHTFKTIVHKTSFLIVKIQSSIVSKKIQSSCVSKILISK